MVDTPPSGPRAIRIERIFADQLDAYAGIPSAFTVESVFEVSPARDGLGGLLFSENPVDPYVKDYDASDDGGVLDWPRLWGVSAWGMFLALDAADAVGGAAVAVGMAQHVPCAGDHECVLWDIRVRPSRRHEGMGGRLFEHAATWAREQGLTRMRIETQNINIPACRFYAKQGCRLGMVHRHGYGDHPDVGHEAMLLWYYDL
jgi:GNAT superfamily N-acetyltransferase